MVFVLWFWRIDITCNYYQAEMSSMYLDKGIWNSEEGRTNVKNVNIVSIQMGFKAKNLDKINKERSTIKKKNMAVPTLQHLEHLQNSN